MLEKLADRHKVGLIRAIKGMMPTSEQVDTLLAAGVEPDHIWNIEKYSIDDLATIVRPDVRDVVVVPFIGVLGKYRWDLLPRFAERGATLYNLAGQEELEISQAATFAYINECCTNAQSAPGRSEILRSGRTGGRKPKRKGAALKEVREAYESGEGTIADICDRFDVSNTWLYNKFGGREDAIRKARKRIVNK